tara:strand:+ start:1151 stop:1639 length:489 start_codon:yes stop_codon:yes gene_type:complete
MNLRQLTHDQEAILSQVEDGDFTLEQVSDHLDMLDSERKQKIENYLHVINRLQNEEVTVTAEIDRLQDIRRSKEKALANIKDWLLMSMKDGEKHDFDLFKVSRVKGRQGVTVIDDKKLPMQFMTHKPESWQPDKRAILAKMKEGEEIAGAELTISKPSLRIK